MNVPGQNSGKSLKNKFKTKGDFVRGVKQAQKRSEARDRQRQMIEAEELKKQIKKSKKNKKSK